MPTREIPCALVRGGTSKGVFLDERTLPADPGERDRLILRLLGSPDARQIDGLGGADPLTSKVAIVGPSTRHDADVEYLSGEVGLGEGSVNFGVMCGNLASGVAHFAIATGLVRPSGPRLDLRIHCRSNDKMIHARVGLVDGQPAVEGDTRIPGVPGAGAEVALRFVDPAGSVTGRLLPTGRAREALELSWGRIELSVVDAGTLYAFVPAPALGIAGTELPDALDRDARLRTRTEELRAQVAQLLTAALAPERSVPARRVKIAACAPATDYATVAGEPVRRDQVDVVARVLNSARAHKAYAVSGAIALGAAAAVPGTVVHELTPTRSSPRTVRIGHPSGVMEVTVEHEGAGGAIRIVAAEVKRTARILMRGTAFVTL